MSGCKQIEDAIHPYIDGELGAAESLEFEAHIGSCGACRKEYEQARAMADTIRGAFPLYDAPEGSKERVEALLPEGRRVSARHYAAVAAMAVLTLGGVALWQWGGTAGDPGADYRAFAAESHLSFARGHMPLDLHSSEPTEISGWLRTRMPFHLEIPNYPEPVNGPAPYALVGTRLLHHGGKDIAYLSYTMDERPISLLVSSDGSTRPLGGRRYESGGLAFHFYSHKGLKLIAWVDRGLSYALVSELDVEGAESCVVCHGDAAEREKFRDLNPVY